MGKMKDFNVMEYKSSGRGSLLVHSLSEEGDKPNTESVIIIPYPDRDNNFGLSVQALHCFVVPYLKVSKKGIYASGLCTASKYLKHLPNISPDDLVPQVEGYLALLGMTEGPPFSVAVFVPPLEYNGLPIDNLDTAVMAGVEAYKEIYWYAHETKLEEAGKMAFAQEHSRCYGLTLSGIRRRFTDKTMTLLYGAPDEVLQELRNDSSLITLRSDMHHYVGTLGRILECRVLESLLGEQGSTPTPLRSKYHLLLEVPIPEQSPEPSA